MNPKIEKISVEIEKLRTKQTSINTRLRELERQKTEIENADIISAVRGVDISPDEFAAFVRMFKEKQGEIVPNIETISPLVNEPIRQLADKTKKEDEQIEN